MQFKFKILFKFAISAKYGLKYKFRYYSNPIIQLFFIYLFNYEKLITNNFILIYINYYHICLKGT